MTKAASAVSVIRHQASFAAGFLQETIDGRKDSKYNKRGVQRSGTPAGSGSEAAVTRLTRNQVVLWGTRVRIPPTPFQENARRCTGILLTVSQLMRWALAGCFLLYRKVLLLENF